MRRVEIESRRVRLAQLSKLLDVSVNQLFDGTGVEEAINISNEMFADLMNQTHALRMLKALACIQDDGTRLAIVRLIERIGFAQFGERPSSHRL